jgi:hypothetical protein
VPSPKTGVTQEQALSPDTRRALHGYLELEQAPTAGILLRALKKNGTLGKGAMATRSVIERVAAVGHAVTGVADLTPQACYRYWERLSRHPDAGTSEGGEQDRET